MLGCDGIEKAGMGVMKYGLLNSGFTMDPDEVKVPTAPYYWFDPATNTTNGGAAFDKV